MGNKVFIRLGCGILTFIFRVSSVPLWSLLNTKQSIPRCILLYKPYVHLAFGQGEMSRKRKAPVASSVGWVNRRAEKQDSDEAEEEEEEEDKSYGGRSMSSRVSLPSKPERK